MGELTAAAIADDLTGALEMGALLAARGLRTAVLLPPFLFPPDADAVVIDTETRHAQPDDAASTVRNAAQALASAPLPACRVFKKIDSTLRGPIEAEVAALQQAFPNDSLVLTPAYPRLGRTVIRGDLYIHGTPLAATAFAHDPRSPVQSSRLPTLRAADAITDEDLRRIAASCSLLAGSGGLGRAWAESIPLGDHPPQHRRATNPLLICGSRHPVSRAQAGRARGLGLPVLTTPDDTGDPAQLEQDLALRAVTAIEARRPDLLIVFGGATAYALLRALAVHRIDALGELRPGIPVSRIGIDTLLVTKAGGFGDLDEVDRILEQLT